MKRITIHPDHPLFVCLFFKVNAEKKQMSYMLKTKQKQEIKELKKKKKLNLQVAGVEG